MRLCCAKPPKPAEASKGRDNRDCELNEVSIPLEFKNAVPTHYAKFTFTLTIWADLDASVFYHVKSDVASSVVVVRNEDVPSLQNLANLSFHQLCSSN
jgi:hypothetical protein